MNISELKEIGLEEINLLFLDDCVYFLTDEIGEVVYIGKSTNIMSRLGKHLFCKEKDFERAFLVNPDDWTIEQVEAALIKYFRPKYNKTVPMQPGIGCNDEMILVDYFIKGNPISTMYQKAVNLL